MTRRRLNSYLRDVWAHDTLAIQNAFVRRTRGCRFGREETRERYFWFRYGWCEGQKGAEFTL